MTFKTLAAALTGATALCAVATAQDYSDHSLVLGMAEIITDPNSGEAGRVVWFQNDLGNGQLTHDFVYNDPRASWDSIPDISIAVKEGRTSSDASLSNQTFWMYESFNVWTDSQCSGVNTTQFAGDSSALGLVENFFLGGGIDLSLIEADITQVGFQGAGPIFAPGTTTLGVAFTLFWVDGDGNFTDIDNNGKFDAAVREIYYNDQYEWADDGQGDRGTGIFDFRAVAIHEAGHGLSPAYFGNIGVKDGALFAKPSAVMNAIYGGPADTLEGRDVASHCSNWAQWPGK